MALINSISNTSNSYYCESVIDASAEGDYYKHYDNGKIAHNERRAPFAQSVATRGVNTEAVNSYPSSANNISDV